MIEMIVLPAKTAEALMPVKYYPIYSHSNLLVCPFLQMTNLSCFYCFKKASSKQI